MSKNAQYVAAFRIKRRQKIIDFLGGECVKCDSTENLEVDHIDPKTKSFNLDAKNIQRKWEILEIELRKCQLLCKTCHKDKSRKGKEQGQILDIQKANEIRKKYSKGDVTQRELAKEYGVHQVTISDVIRRKNWN